MSKVKFAFINYIVFILVISSQMISAKEIIGIEVKQASNIYAGGNACYVSSENKVIYINEVMNLVDDHTFLIYLMEDKSKFLWATIQKDFNIAKISKSISEAKEEDIAAGSTPFGLNVYYSDGEVISVSSFKNPDLIKLYRFIDDIDWAMAKNYLPKNIKAEKIDLFKSNAISISDKIK